MIHREMKLAADRTLGHHRPAIATYFPTSIKLTGACDRPSRLRSLNASASGYTEEGSRDQSQVSPPSANRRVVPPLSTVRVPHCGYHYDGAPRRFFEGWYWKVSGLLSEQQRWFHAMPPNPMQSILSPFRILGLHSYQRL